MNFEQWTSKRSRRVRSVHLVFRDPEIRRGDTKRKREVSLMVDLRRIAIEEIIAREKRIVIAERIE